jgi:hypothetical protein
MENKGLEFDLTTINIDTKDFKWRTSLILQLIRIRFCYQASIGPDGNRFISGGFSQLLKVILLILFLVRYSGTKPEMLNGLILMGQPPVH